MIDPPRYLDAHVRIIAMSKAIEPLNFVGLKWLRALAYLRAGIAMDDIVRFDELVVHAERERRRLFPVKRMEVA